MPVQSLFGTRSPRQHRIEHVEVYRATYNPTGTAPALVEVSRHPGAAQSAWVRSSGVRAGVAQRARIVLLAADGVSNTDIAARAGVSRPTVISWRARYEASGIGGLRDEPRSGRPRTIDHEAIIAATLTPPPKKLGITHWSCRLLAARLRIDASTVARGLSPRRCWRCSPGCPSGAPMTTSGRHGTTTLFAALEIASGQVTATCQPRHRHQEFLQFLKQVARAYPGVQLHWVMDNYAAHKRVEVRDWLEANPRVHVHFTPTSASWLNLVEVWFGIIERQAIHRGSYRSVKDLNAKIRAFVDGWNDRAHPFVWTKSADQILTKADRQKTSKSGH